MQPLTHHEILTLAAPFARSGRRVDLAASRRQERRLRFVPTEPLAGLVETLELDLGGAVARLERTLDAGGGLQAQLLAEGAAGGELLARVDAVAPQSQIEQGAAGSVARSYRLERPAAAGTPPPASAPPAAPGLLLTRAEARIAGGLLTLTLALPPGRRVPATIDLRAAAGACLALPDDLLAVLGLPWSRLTLLSSHSDAWRCTLQLRGRGPARSRDAEAQLQRAVQHLAQTLAAAPAQFHERHRAARWRVALRRGVPLLVCLALFAAAAIVPRYAIASESLLLMLVFNAPPLLLALLFGLRELPRFEIPPLPRRLRAPQWQTAAAGRADAAAAAAPLPAAQSVPTQPVPAQPVQIGR